MVMIDGKRTLLLVVNNKESSCDCCYFDDNTCPNNDICIIGNGYWKDETEVKETDIVIDN